MAAIRLRKKASTMGLNENCVLMLLVEEPRDWKGLLKGGAAQFVQPTLLGSAQKPWGKFRKTVTYEIWSSVPLSALGGDFRAQRKRRRCVYFQLTEDQMRELLPQRLLGVIDNYPTAETPEDASLSVEAVAWVEKQYNRQRENANHEHSRLKRDCPESVTIEQVKELCLQIDAREGWRQPEELLEAVRQILQAGPYPEDLHAIIHVLDAAQKLGFELLDEHGAENVIQQVRASMPTALGDSAMAEEQTELSLEQRIELALREIFRTWDKIPGRLTTEFKERIRQDLIAKEFLNNEKVMGLAWEITRRLYAEVKPAKTVAPKPPLPSNAVQIGPLISLAGLGETAADKVKLLIDFLARVERARIAAGEIASPLSALALQLEELRQMGKQFGDAGQSVEVVIAELLKPLEGLSLQSSIN